MASGGKRQGAGRKLGSKNKATLEKRAIQEAFNQRVMTHADALFNAQLQLAVGSVRIFRVDEELDEKGKPKRVHTLVTNADEQKDVLDELDGEGSGTVGEDYYFITEVPPSNAAIDSMLNRTLGKPKDSLDVTSNGETLATRVILPTNDN